MVYRPDNVVGSYAVYSSAQDLGNRKLYHIYRPLIIDAKGSRVWANLTVTKTQMQIYIDAEWLSKAVYPVVVDPTFGKTDIGGSEYTYWGYGPRDEKIACLFTLSESASVASISMYLEDYSGSGKADSLVFGVYNTDDDLLGQTAVGSVPAYLSPAWVTLEFGSPVELSAGDYWLAALVDDIRCRYYYDSGDAGQTKGEYPDDFADGMSDPFGSADWSGAFEGSIYANYTTGGPSHTDAELSETIIISSSLETQKNLYRSISETLVIEESFITRKQLTRTCGESTEVTTTITTQKDIGVTMLVEISQEIVINGALYTTKHIAATLIEFFETVNLTALLVEILPTVPLTTEDLIGLIILFFIIALAIAVAALGLTLKKKG